MQGLFIKHKSKTRTRKQGTQGKKGHETIYIQRTSDKEQGKHKSYIYTYIYTRANKLTRHTREQSGLINGDYKNYKDGTRSRKQEQNNIRVQT